MQDWFINGLFLALKNHSYSYKVMIIFFAVDFCNTVWNFVCENSNSQSFGDKKFSFFVLGI